MSQCKSIASCAADDGEHFRHCPRVTSRRVQRDALLSTPHAPACSRTCTIAHAQGRQERTPAVWRMSVAKADTIPTSIGKWTLSSSVLSFLRVYMHILRLIGYIFTHGAPKTHQTSPGAESVGCPTPTLPLSLHATQDKTQHPENDDDDDDEWDRDQRTPTHRTKIKKHFSHTTQPATRTPGVQK